jgi:hypothetical protein
LFLNEGVRDGMGRREMERREERRRAIEQEKMSDFCKFHTSSL